MVVCSPENPQQPRNKVVFAALCITTYRAANGQTGSLVVGSSSSNYLNSDLMSGCHYSVRTSNAMHAHSYSAYLFGAHATHRSWPFALTHV